jgi:hypothetical protein
VGLSRLILTSCRYLSSGLSASGRDTAASPNRKCTSSLALYQAALLNTIHDSGEPQAALTIPIVRLPCLTNCNKWRQGTTEENLPRLRVMNGN